MQIVLHALDSNLSTNDETYDGPHASHTSPCFVWIEGSVFDHMSTVNRKVVSSDTQLILQASLICTTYVQHIIKINVAVFVKSCVSIASLIPMLSPLRRTWE